MLGVFLERTPLKPPLKAWVFFIAKLRTFLESGRKLWAFPSSLVVKHFRGKVAAIHELDSETQSHVMYSVRLPM